MQYLYDKVITSTRDLSIGLMLKLFVWISLGLGSHIAQAESTPLHKYVQTPDPAFSYELLDVVPGDGFTLYYINMTSQVWRSPSELSPNLWNHWLTVVVPEVVITSKAHLFIDGGSNSTSPPGPDSLAQFPTIAMATGTPVAVLRQIPSQPLTASDREHPMIEDDLVAYSWKKAMETGDPTWAAYFPMTKAAVRAMDTVEQALLDILGHSPSGFIVTGFSKRGATAWLTAAVDDRVEAVVPGAFNVLSIAQQVDNQFENYGKYAEAVQDYVDEEVLQEIRSPEGVFLTNNIDPLSYAQALTMPHFIVSASGDEFFLPDASQLFIDKIPGEVRQRIIPNESHSLQRNLEQNLTGLIAWYQSILLNTPRPEIRETVLDNGQLRIEASKTPLSATLWTAYNPTSRDFRFDTIGAAWVPQSISPSADGVFSITVPEPAEGYTAYLVEFVFQGASNLPEIYTTNTYVTPESRPFTLETTISHPRSPRYWKYRVTKALLGIDTKDKLKPISDMLPILVRGQYLTSLNALKTALSGHKTPSQKALSACTATRLNIEAGELGWYALVAPDTNLWARVQAAETHPPRKALKLCRRLNQAP